MERPKPPSSQAHVKPWQGRCAVTYKGRLFSWDQSPLRSPLGQLGSANIAWQPSQSESGGGVTDGRLGPRPSLTPLSVRGMSGPAAVAASGQPSEQTLSLPDPLTHNAARSRSSNDWPHIKSRGTDGILDVLSRCSGSVIKRGTEYSRLLFNYNSQSKSYS